MKEFFDNKINELTKSIAEGNVLIKKNKEMIATADKGIISENYEKFRIVGKTTTKLYEGK